MPPIDDFTDAFGEFTGGRYFDSLEELNAVLAEFTCRSNRQRLANFDGLSPDQVRSVLYQPFGLFELRPPECRAQLKATLSYRVPPLYRQLLQWDR